jgi:hypothetical protein
VTPHLAPRNLARFAGGRFEKTVKGLEESLLALGQQSTSLGEHWDGGAEGVPHHSGRPASRRPSESLARSSGRRRGIRSVRLEIRSAGSS